MHYDIPTLTKDQYENLINLFDKKDTSTYADKKTGSAIDLLHAFLVEHAGNNSIANKCSKPKNIH